MEHVNQERPAFYSEVDRSGFIRVWQNKPRRPVLCVMGGNSFSKAEEVMWANRAARALCYDTAGVERARRAGIRGLLCGFALGCAAMWGAMLGLGYLPPSQCVQLGDYTSVPNG